MPRSLLTRSAGIRVVLAARAVGVSHWDEVRRGVAAYARQAGWTLLTDPDDATTSLADFLSWPSDGVIATVTSPGDLRRAKSCGRPVVNISAVLDDTTLPQVTFDNHRIGALAAGHLALAGYTAFASVGLDDVHFSHERERGFAETLAKEGHACLRISMPSMLGHRRRGVGDVDLHAWLETLPYGTGIFIVTDSRAEQVLRACAEVGRRVPADLGVLGVGDFRDICEMASPSMSSVHRQGHEVGFAAAKTLAKLIGKRRGSGAPPRLVLPPAGVVARDSTARASTGTTLVSEVTRYLAEHGAEQFGVERIVSVFGVARRTLERGFMDELGVSPAAYLRRLRAQKAIEFASAHSGLTLAEIARACGFTDEQHLRRTLTRLDLALPTEPVRGRSGFADED